MPHPQCGWVDGLPSTLPLFCCYCYCYCCCCYCRYCCCYPQAVFLGAHLTCGWVELDRLPIGFRSRVNDQEYR